MPRLANTVPEAQLPLAMFPPDIAMHRQYLFALNEPVTMSAGVYARFWPFIDNVWCFHARQDEPKPAAIEKMYGICRLTRRLEVPKGEDGKLPKFKGSRKRGDGMCQARFKIFLYPDGTRVIQRNGEDKHSHELDIVDRLKRPTAVRNIVFHDYFKNWEAAAIFAYLRDVRHREDERDVLKEAGGQYLTRLEVSNIMSQAFRKKFAGQDIAEVRKQAEKYKTYSSCEHRGCFAPPFPDRKSLLEHVRTVHGRKIHDHSDKVVFCPEKGCQRSKKSKGFTSETGLQEHLRRAHGASAAHPSGEADAPWLFESALEHSLGQEQTLTPNSTSADSDIVADEVADTNRRASQQARATTGLTSASRQEAQARLNKLEAERARLDIEIRMLQAALVADNGDQPGKIATSYG